MKPKDTAAGTILRIRVLPFALDGEPLYRCRYKPPDRYGHVHVAVPRLAGPYFFVVGKLASIKGSDRYRTDDGVAGHRHLRRSSSESAIGASFAEKRRQAGAGTRRSGRGSARSA